MKTKFSSPVKRGTLLRGVLMAAVVAACGMVSRESAARVDPQAAISPGARPAGSVVAKAPGAPASMNEVYGQREAAAPNLAQFKGGGHLAVGSTLVVVLLIVLIVILL